MSTASNLMEDSYESCIQTPEFFAKLHGDADEPDQVGYKTKASHLLDFISISSSSFNVQDYILKVGEEQQSVDSVHAEDLPESSEESQQSSIQDDSENSEVTQPVRRTNPRKDNNNNIHKIFITDLNNCLKTRSMLKPIQQMLKRQKTKFTKGSRPSFVFRLIDIKHLFGQDFLTQILEDFRKKIQRHLKLPYNPTPAQRLLMNLVDVYEEASHIFEAGDEAKTVVRIYTIEKAKEETYKNEGVKKVEEYLAKRTSK